jgi:hypothetical protein
MMGEKDGVARVDTEEIPIACGVSKYLIFPE